MSLIKLENVNVLGVNNALRTDNLKKHFIALFSGKKNPSFYVPILKNISLTINTGEKVGIIGSNGSGKSSLLKVIASIYPPASGTLIVRGSVIPIIEMGIGFNPELTGRENIYLAFVYFSCLHLYSKGLEEEIILFSELGEKIDIPIKYYSSGMNARLAFSVVVHMHADILILDEVFATGDRYFLSKSKQFMKSKVEKACISLMVNHSLDEIRENCTRCIYMKQGEVHSDGPPDQIINEYLKDHNL